MLVILIIVLLVLLFRRKNLVSDLWVPLSMRLIPLLIPLKKRVSRRCGRVMLIRQILLAVSIRRSFVMA